MRAYKNINIDKPLQAIFTSEDGQGMFAQTS